MGGNNGSDSSDAQSIKYSAPYKTAPQHGQYPPPDELLQPGCRWELCCKEHGWIQVLKSAPEWEGSGCFYEREPFTLGATNRYGPPTI